MKKEVRNGIFAALLLAVIVVAAFSLVGQSAHLSPSAISGAPYAGPPLRSEYRNETFRFSLLMPEGFTAGELPPDENGATAIVLQNEAGEGIQLYIVPSGDERTLSADAVRLALPDLMVEAPETVGIGNGYRGVAFLSNNPAFEGASREVWFYFRGNLYQISTYARLDGLLKEMFSTWTFF